MSQKEPVKIMLKISQFKKKIISLKNLELQKNLHNAACVKVCQKSPAVQRSKKWQSECLFNDSRLLVVALKEDR